MAFRNWIRDAGRRQRPLRQVRPGDPDGQRLEPREPGGVVLQDPPRAGGDDGEHDATVPGRPVQLQQVPRPPLRALDPGPVLPDGRLLRPGRPEGRPGRQGADDRRHDVEAPKPLYEVVADTGKGEVIHDRTKNVTAAQVPVPARHIQAAERHRAASRAGRRG